jgi:tetratricopeptide (TPR) repeat protein
LGEKHANYALSLHNLAMLYMPQGYYSKAEPLLRKSVQILKDLGEKDPDYATSQYNLAYCYFLQKDFAKAEPLYLKALEIRKEVQGEKHADYAASLSGLAVLYWHQRNYWKAEPLFRKALEIEKELLGEKHFGYATVLDNLACFYDSQGSYAKAERLFHEALEIRKEVLGEKHPDYAATLHHLARLYKSKGNYAKAEALVRKALKIRKEVLGEKHPDYAFSLTSLAVLYDLQGIPGKAEPLMHHSLEIQKEVLGEKHPDYAMALINLAMMYYDEGNDVKPEALFRQALAVSQITSKPLPFEQLAAADLRLHPNTVHLLGGLAKSIQRSTEKNARTDRLRLADRSFFLALEILDRVRQEILDQEVSKIQLTSDMFELFPDRMKVLHKLFALEKKSQDLEAAFSTAEQGTARVFLEYLGKNRANFLAGVSRKLHNEEQQLLRGIRLLDARIDTESARPVGKRDADLVGKLLIERRDTEKELKQLIARMEKEYPQYAGLKYPQPCKLEEARACMAPDELALLFVPGIEASFIVLVEARPKPDDMANGIAIIELPAAAALAAVVSPLIDQETLGLPRAKILARDPFDKLLGPCKERIKDKCLVIVPNGPLCSLPFELLVEEDSKYLVEKHRIRYAPSLTALHLINLWKQKRVNPEVPLFAVGDPLYDKSFERLEHSGFEVAEIAKKLGARDEFVLTRDKASKSEVKKASEANAMGKARYVHFATHGIFGLDRGKQPALVLSQTRKAVVPKLEFGNEELAESFLQMDEITGLKLNADLVVLSACKSGQGRLHQGEGVTGLARAFLYAGSKGVVCSLWSVDDRETANLMVDLYTNLQKGSSAPEALRESQLTMIRAGKAPLYWAPFIVIGE